MVIIVNNVQAKDLALLFKRGTLLPNQLSEVNLTYDMTSNAAEGKHYVLLQFPHLPTSTEREQLKQHGITLLDYVPEQTFWASIKMARFSSEVQEMLSKLVTQIGTLPNVNYKISSAIEANQFPSNARYDDDSVKIYVEMFEDVVQEDLLKIVKPFSVDPPEWIAPHLLAMRLFPQQIGQLAEIEAIKWIEPALPPNTAHNATASQRIHVDKIRQAPYHLEGEDITIGIWDSGHVDAAHPDFSDRVLWMDDSEIDLHATHVAGTIGGSGQGNPQAKGMAPKVLIHSFDWDDDIKEMTVATENGLKLSNHSYGATLGWHYDKVTKQWSLDDDVFRFGAYETETRIWDIIVLLKGLIIFKSAGNDRHDGPGRDEGWCPNDSQVPEYMEFCDGPYDILDPKAVAKNVITVGATTDDDNMTTFSSWGPTDDGRIKPDLCANGEGLTSTVPDNQYFSGSGTSMASPSAAGAGVLLYQYFQQQNTHAPQAATLKALMIHGAQDVGRPGPDYQYGWGLINAKKSLDLIKNHRWATSSFSTVDETWSKEVEVTDAQAIKVTLVWTDYPGNPQVQKSLVNDLDMILRAPDGSIYKPWILDGSRPEQVATTGENHTDNVEQIMVKHPVSGTWRIEVTAGIFASEDSQAFSVVFNSEPSLAVTLNSFAVKAHGNRLHVNWSTDIEKDNSGMNVWCAQIHNNQFAHVNKLNRDLVFSQAPFSYSGSDYKIEKDVDINGNYYCLLENIDYQGHCTMHCAEMATIAINTFESMLDLKKAQQMCRQVQSSCIEDLLKPF